MLSCTKCATPLPARVINTYSMVACPSCEGLMRADVYPSLYRRIPAGHSGEMLQMDKEAGCFYHPRKKAVVPCSACGRFVCALCDVAINGEHLCPACFEKGKTKQKINNLENRRTCYDTIVLLIATVSILVYWFTIFTAPLVIYLTIRHWNSPSSVIPRSKIRFVLAFIIAGLQIAGWLFVFSNLFLLSQS